MAKITTAQYQLDHSTDGYEFFITANISQPRLQIGHAVSYLEKLDYGASTATICFPGQEEFVFVAPEYRNSGIGTAMIRYTGEVLKEFYDGAISRTLAHAVTSSQSLPYYQKVFGAKLIPGTGVNGQLQQIWFEI